MRVLFFLLFKFSVLHLNTAITPSSTPSSLPAACNPLLQPYEIHATEGTFGIGSRGSRRVLAAATTSFMPVPLPVYKSDCSGDDCAFDDDNKNGGGNDDGESFDDDDDDELIMSHSQVPVPSSTSNGGGGSGGGGSDEFLPLGLICIWVLDGGGTQIIDLEYEWIRVGNTSLNNPSCAIQNNNNAEGDVLSTLDGIAGTTDITSFDTPCYYDESSSVRHIISSGNSSALTIMLIISPPQPPSSSTVSTAVSSSRGFRARFRMKPKEPIQPQNSDCVMGPWSPFGACSVACGPGGVITRTRNITNQATGNGTCFLPTVFSVACPLAPSCAPTAPRVACTLSDWSIWSTCSLTHSQIGCGNGTQVRTRSIVRPATGGGTPCPLPSALHENKICFVPCLHPACISYSKPLEITATMAPIPMGIGSPPRAPLSRDAPISLASLPPRYIGNTNCTWIIHAPNANTIVTLNFWWLDVPASPGCVSKSQGRVAVHSGDNGGTIELLPPQCGSVWPPALRHWSGPPGGGFTISFYSSDETTSVSSGFGAIISSEIAPPAPPSSPPAQPSTSHTFVTLTLIGGGPLWNNLVVGALLAGARSDISFATHVDSSRFISLSVTKERNGETVLSFLITPSLSSTDKTIQWIINSLYTQAREPHSILRNGAITRGLREGPLSVSAVWTTPSQSSIDPSIGGVTLSATTGPSKVTIKISNIGGSPLVITSATLLWAQVTPSSSPIIINPSVTLPTLLPSSSIGSTHASVVFTLDIDVEVVKAINALKDSPTTMFAVFSITHSDIDGPHSVPVTLTLHNPPSPPSSPSTNSNSNDSSSSFTLGFTFGIGLLSGLLCLSSCVFICCIRRKTDGRTIFGKLLAALREDENKDRKKFKATPARASPSSPNGGGGGGGGGNHHNDDGSGEGEEDSLTANGKVEIELTSVIPTSSPWLGGISVPMRGAVTPTTTTMITAISSPSTMGTNNTSTMLPPLPTITSPPSAPSRGGLRSRPILKASDFEQRWASLPSSEIWGTTITRGPRDGEMERSLQLHHLACMASGAVNGIHKYYFFAQNDILTDTTNLVIGELTLTDSTKRLSVMIKATSPELGLFFLDALKEGLEDAFFIRDLEV